MKKNRLKKIIVGIIILIAIFFVYINSITYRADKQDLEVFKEPSSEYSIEEKIDYIKLDTGNMEAYNIVFYNGALVESKAYASLAKSLAEKGYNVYLLKTKFNLPILSMNKAKKIIEKERLDKVILAGHSLGGVVAAMNVSEIEDVAGLILLASYPASKTNLIKENFPVISLVGENDKIIKWDKYEDSKKLLPKDTIFIKIKGGNHSGFADYGKQNKDAEADISNSSQQEEVVKAVGTVFK